MAGNKKIVIFGAGGHGKVVLDILLNNGKDVLGFIDDNTNKNGQRVNGFEVVGGWSYLEKSRSVVLALGIGDNKVREKIFTRAKSLGIDVISAIHPGATVSRFVKMGEGVVIMPGSVINTNVVLEDGVVVNTSASVDHDCHLGRFCQVWPGARLAGEVQVGEFSYIGTGAAIIPNVVIGKNVLIGAGAIVLDDIQDNVTTAGAPARIIKR